MKTEQLNSSTDGNKKMNNNTYIPNTYTNMGVYNGNAYDSYQQYYQRHNAAMPQLTNSSAYDDVKNCSCMPEVCSMRADY